MNRLLYGKKRPMIGTLKPKGTYEERTRKDYVEKKQKSIEESLRVIAMRKMVCVWGGWLMFSGGISRRIGNDDQVHRGINLNAISDRYEFYCDYNFAFVRFWDSYCWIVEHARSPRGNIFVPYR